MFEHPKYFAHDHLLRDALGRPQARVVLADDYVPGEDIKVSILTIPGNRVKDIRGLSFFVDGEQYTVPRDLPDVKVSFSRIQTKVSSFIMKKG